MSDIFLEEGMFWRGDFYWSIKDLTTSTELIMYFYQISDPSERPTRIHFILMAQSRNVPMERMLDLDVNTFYRQDVPIGTFVVKRQFAMHPFIKLFFVQAQILSH